MSEHAREGGALCDELFMPCASAAWWAPPGSLPAERANLNAPATTRPASPAVCAPGFGRALPASGGALSAAPACARCPEGHVSGPDAPAGAGGRGGHGRGPFAACVACPAGLKANKDQTECA